MDQSHFTHLMELRDSGHVEEHIRESERLLLTELVDSNEKASLLIGEHVSYLLLGRLSEARRALDRIKQLEISDLDTRLNAEFCEPCLLIDEGKPEEGISAFGAILQRYAEALKEPTLRYLYEDIQLRRAWALFGLCRCTEALPILEEARSFSLENVSDEQRMHFALGICYEEAGRTEPAKNEYFRVAEFNLSDDLEERARYRLARLLVLAGGFAQARTQLETIVQTYDARASAVPQAYVLKLLSQACARLGDHPNAERYADLARRARHGPVGNEELLPGDQGPANS